MGPGKGWRGPRLTRCLETLTSSGMSLVGGQGVQSYCWGPLRLFVGGQMLLSLPCPPRRALRSRVSLLPEEGGWEVTDRKGPKSRCSHTGRQGGQLAGSRGQPTWAMPAGLHAHSPGPPGALQQGDREGGRPPHIPHHGRAGRRQDPGSEWRGLLRAGQRSATLTPAQAWLKPRAQPLPPAHLPGGRGQGALG